MPRLAIHAVFTIKPELADAFEPIMKQAMRDSLTEPGTEYYVVTRDKETRNTFRVFEIYESPEAFHTHHYNGVVFNNIMKWTKENDALLDFRGEKHDLLEDMEKGIVGV